MNRRTLSLVPLAAAVAVPLLAASVGVASAATHPTPKGAPAKAAPAGQAPSSKVPGLSPSSAFEGYQQVMSAALTDSAGGQAGGSVACPTGTKLVGGGAVISSSSLSENLNASYPGTDGLTWRVFVNNSSSTSGIFRVYADCVKKISKYAVVSGTGVDNPAASQNSATVACPAKTVPLGGGGYASSGSTAVNLNSSIPVSTGWRTDVNNASSADDTATAYVICGKKPTGYALVAGTSVTANASSQTSASVACPSGTAVLGGGGYSTSGSTAVDLNTSAPSGSTYWFVYENNGSPASAGETAYAICAKAAS